MRKQNPLLIEVLPDLAEEVRQTLIAAGKHDLSESIESLHIAEVCDCGDPDCGSFYLIELPNEEEAHEVEGFVVRHGIVVEVIDGKVGYVEIIPSNEGFKVRGKIKESLY